MKKFVIERRIDGVGRLNDRELSSAAATSSQGAGAARAAGAVGPFLRSGGSHLLHLPRRGGER